jgi:hypothetical protein
MTLVPAGYLFDTDDVKHFEAALFAGFGRIRGAEGSDAFLTSVALSSLVRFVERHP